MTATSVTEASNVPKPVLRGHAMSHYGKMLYIGLFISGCVSFAFKKLICETRQKKYKDFYENYDALKEYQRKRDIGIFKGFEK